MMLNIDNIRNLLNYWQLIFNKLYREDGVVIPYEDIQVVRLTSEFFITNEEPDVAHGVATTHYPEGVNEMLSAEVLMQYIEVAGKLALYWRDKLRDIKINQFIRLTKSDRDTVHETATTLYSFILLHEARTRQ